MNKEQNAGTVVDNDLQPIVIPSASLAQNPLLAAVLSKLDVIAALAEGKKVTHVYFTSDEFIYQYGDYYFDENGYAFKPELFWLHRDKPCFETGWSLYGS